MTFKSKYAVRVENYENLMNDLIESASGDPCWGIPEGRPET